MKRTFLIIFTVLIYSASIFAENAIDEAINHFSQSGDCKFSSVVVRDNDGKKVTKVIKMLQLFNHDESTKMMNIFQKELGNAKDVIENQDGKSYTKIITVETTKESRIYKLAVDNTSFPTTSKVTLIIIYNKRQRSAK